MKTSKIELAGKHYITCFSLHAVLACEDKFGSVVNALEKIDKEGKEQQVKTTLWMLYELMKAGEAYCRVSGIQQDPIPGWEDFVSIVGLDDLTVVSGVIGETVAAGTTRNVEALPEKKTGAEAGE